MIRGASEEFIKVYALGEYGAVMTGRLVFPQYNDDLHSVVEIKTIEGVDVVIGWDFGLTPACLITQFADGRVLAIKEFTTEHMGLQELAETLVLPYLRAAFTHNEVITSVCDPSGSAGVATDNVSCITVLGDLGLDTSGASTNAIVPRIEAVNWFLNRLSAGQTAILISRTGCPMLRKGLLGKYCYKRIRSFGEDKYRDMPDKSHPFSDIQDCLQYISLHYNDLGGVDRKPFKADDYRLPAQSMWV